MTGNFVIEEDLIHLQFIIKIIEEKNIILKLAPKTSIVPVENETRFYPVRLEHQDYYKKQSYKYEYYRFLCRRDQRLEILNN